MADAADGLTAGDWIGVILVGLCALFCFQFPFFVGPAFAKMYADFGSTLPALSELILTTWFPLMVGLNPASVAFYAVAGEHPLKRRRALIVAAFVLGVIAVGVLLVGAYQPVFAVARAGAIE